MTHPLAGFLEVDESARTVRHYRYVTERMTVSYTHLTLPTTERV